MRSGESFPNDQAEIVFNDLFLEYLESLTPAQREDVLVEVVRLCTNPGGSHPLSNRTSSDSLAGWNTLDVLQREHRVVFGSRVIDGIGVIEVLCGGPRRGEEAYDIANALIRSGRLSDDDATEIWDALSFLEVLAEDVDLDGWDYAPPAAPDGMVKSAVGSGLLDAATASVLSKDELEAAMEHGWGPNGPDPVAALIAAMRRARASAALLNMTGIMDGRRADRCTSILPRSGAKCIRRAGHPGAHRSTV